MWDWRIAYRARVCARDELALAPLEKASPSAPRMKTIGFPARAMIALSRCESAFGKRALLDSTWTSAG